MSEFGKDQHSLNKHLHKREPKTIEGNKYSFRNKEYICSKVLLFVHVDRSSSHKRLNSRNDKHKWFDYKEYVGFVFEKK